jgi:Carboxypeptidase regulatory-like domain
VVLALEVLDDMARAIHVALAVAAALLYNASCRRFPVGTIEGTVTDRYGAPIAHANVGGILGARGLPSDSSGRYRLTHVPVGVHRLSASGSGFLRAERDSIVVRKGTSTVVDFTLDRTWETWELQETSPQATPGAEEPLEVPGGSS